MLVKMKMKNNTQQKAEKFWPLWKKGGKTATIEHPDRQISSGIGSNTSGKNNKTEHQDRQISNDIGSKTSGKIRKQLSTQIGNFHKGLAQTQVGKQQKMSTQIGIFQ